MLSLGNSSRHYLEKFASDAAATVSAGGIVLDAGAGEQPYGHLFRHLTYETADFKQQSDNPTTYVCDLTKIPVEDDRFDLVLCTQVLEHMPDPLAVLQELRRVVKPTGSIWLSAPLYFEEHQQPYDFYRYTQYGFAHLATCAGLNIESITWLEGYYGTLAHHFAVACGKEVAAAMSNGADGKRTWGRTFTAKGLRVLFWLLSKWFEHRDLEYIETSVGMPINYALVLTKSA